MFGSSKYIGFLKVASFKLSCVALYLLSEILRIEIKRGRTKRTANSSNFQFSSSSVFGNFSDKNKSYTMRCIKDV